MWQSIAFDLEREIRQRGISPGDKLPTEHALARKYFATRHVVRRALAHLQSKGLIESTQGRGSFARRPTLPMHIQRRTRFSETVEGIGAKHEHRTLILDVRRAEVEVAQAFGVRVGTPILCLERLAIVNDQPTSISRHHFLNARVPCFATLYESRGSITATLRDLGILDYVRVQTKIHARLPTPEECKLLEMPRHVPLMTTQSINHDMNGVMLEYGEARFAADRVDLVIEPQRLQ
jgi:GntR family transcriptional regulator, phosphonate transport system regulatory protein